LTLVKEARLSVVTGQFARALILLLVCTAQTAHAQVTVDVSKITCEQFIVLPKADSVAVWLSGYYNGKRGNTVIDTQGLASENQKLRDFCITNPQMPVMDAAEKLFGVSR